MASTWGIYVELFDLHDENSDSIWDGSIDDLSNLNESDIEKIFGDNTYLGIEIYGNGINYQGKINIYKFETLTSFSDEEIYRLLAVLYCSVCDINDLIEKIKNGEIEFYSMELRELVEHLVEERLIPYEMLMNFIDWNKLEEAFEIDGYRETPWGVVSFTGN